MPQRPITVRRATLADAEAARRALAEVNLRAVNDAAVQEFLRDPSCYLFLAESDGAPVGALNGYALRRPFRPEPQFLLYEVDVSRDWQSQGIGKKLVTAFLEEARRSGAFELWVLTDRSNHPAVRMYAQCGLREENPAAHTIMMNILLR